MAEPIKDDVVKEWEERIESAERYRDQHTTYKDWDQYLKYYRGEWKPGVQAANKIFAYIRTMVPRIYFRDPVVTVTASRPEFEWHARVVETLDNWLIRELNLKAELKRAILDALLFGIGILKHGFDSEFGYVTKQAMQEDGSAVTQAGTDTVSKIEYKTNVKAGMPWSLRVDPRDILFPPGYTDPTELPWIANRIIRPLDDCKEDAKYDAKARRELKGGFTIKGNAQGKANLLQKEKENFVELWEIRDAKYKRLVVIAEGKLLLSVDDACQIESIPYDFIVFNADPDSLWGVPDIKMVEHEQLELNSARTSAAIHRRISVLKFLYLKGAITKETLDTLNSDNPGAGVEINGDTLNNAVAVMTGHTPNNTYQEIQEIERSIRETLGHGSNQAGAPMGVGTPKTATEVMAVEKGVEIREDERRDILADVLTFTVRKWNQFIFSFWTDKRVIEVVGPEGATQWIRYSGTQLKDEYITRVDPDSGMPVTRILRYQQAKEIFTMLNGDPLTDQMLLRKMLLRQTQWIDPSWALVIGQQAQTLDMNTLAFLKQGGELPGNPEGSGPMPGNPSTAGQFPTGGPKPNAGVQLPVSELSGPTGSA